MMNQQLGILFAILLLSSTIHLSVSTEENEDDDVAIETVEEADTGMRIQFAGEDAPNTFVPTREWQTVQPGQPIPKGLHIRYNLQTGLTEAKLLDEEDQKQSTSATTEHGEEAPDDQQQVSGGTSLVQVEDSEGKEDTSPKQSPDDSARAAGQSRMKMMLEQAVKDMEREEKLSTEEAVKYWKDGDKEGMMNLQGKTFSHAELKDALKKFKIKREDEAEQKHKEEIRSKFRSYEELKREMEEMDMGIKSDLEVLQELMTSYRDPAINMETKVNILTDLEYHLHQIDNAQNFVTMGGIPLLLQDLNSTEEALRSEAAFVLGSATQSNPQVQISCLDTGVLSQLIRMLATDPSPVVRSRVLYAMSALVRYFPFAQQKLLDLGGFHVLSQILTHPANGKLKVKTVTLVTDLVLEQKLAIEGSDGLGEKEEAKKEQYQQLQLTKHLKEHNWCKLIPELLETSERDTQEKVLQAMSALVDTCREQFGQGVAQATLTRLKQEFTVLSEEEISSGDDDEYFRGLLKNVDNLMNILSLHDEL